MWDADLMNALRKAYNKERSKGKPIPAGSPEKVWKELKKRLHADCDEEACLVTAMIDKPKAPKSWKSNPIEWLSSVDIERVEGNYAKLIPDYYFVGCVPIDFAAQSDTGSCLVSALCSMDIRKLYKKGYERIGIVFNTDPHDEPGEHWIAAFCDIRPTVEQPRFVYFDSYAQKPEKEIIDLMNAWKAQWDEAGIHKKPMILEYNKTRHQYKNTECGMYCIYFHHCCLFEIPMNKRIPDDVMALMRGYFFKL